MAVNGSVDVPKLKGQLAVQRLERQRGGAGAVAALDVLAVVADATSP